MERTWRACQAKALLDKARQATSARGTSAVDVRGGASGWTVIREAVGGALGKMLKPLQAAMGAGNDEALAGSEITPKPREEAAHDAAHDAVIPKLPKSAKV